MKPVAILRHSPTEGPGYFATVLDGRAIPWTLIRVDAGDALPASADDFAGIALMGGPMSVNDELPWIAPALALINSAVRADIPVLGHCLGSQLMSKALGGAVRPNPVKEIGWGRVDVDDSAPARAWFGGTRCFLSFQWHGETFSLPAGAVRIASSPACANQAFVLGKHLGMQCHVEMTAALVRAWCESGREEIAQCACATVQQVDEIQSHLQPRLAALNAVATRLYDRWIEGLRR